MQIRSVFVAAMFLLSATVPAVADQLVAIVEGSPPAVVGNGVQTWNAGSINLQLRALGIAVSFPNGDMPALPVKAGPATIVAVTVTPPGSLNPYTQSAANGTPSIAKDESNNPTGVSITQTASSLPASTACQNLYNLGMASGVAIASTADSGRTYPYLLTGVYPLDDHHGQLAANVSEHSSWLTGFPNGANHLNWFDLAGGLHVFTATADWQNAWNASTAYVSALSDALLACIQSNGTWTWPQGVPAISAIGQSANPITIN